MADFHGAALILRTFLLLTAAAMLAACGGSDGNDSGAAALDQPAPTDSHDPFAGGFAAPQPAPGNNAGLLSCKTPNAELSGTVSGRLVYERIPSDSFSGLDYSAVQRLPIRGAVVEAAAGSAQGGCSDTVLATTVSDGNGEYALDVAAGQAVCVRVRAQLWRDAGSGGPGWDIQVSDNSRANAPYLLVDGPATPAQEPVRNLLAASGWDGLRYSAQRSAAPFAILDSACEALDTLLSVSAGQQLPTLQLRWSPRNIAAEGDLGLGEVGNPFYRKVSLINSRGDLLDTVDEIFLLGDQDNDTDEYDAHVIAHEMAHFIAANLFRADALGGAHGLGDRLDMTVAFEEGWANAFSAIALQAAEASPALYSDSFGPAQGSSFRFDIERLSTASVGWYSESSVHKLMYNLYDQNNQGEDSISLGFSPLFQALRSHADTPAMTSIFSFAAELLEQRPSERSAINRLLASEQFEVDDSGLSGIDAFASNEQINSDVAGDPDVVPVYAALAPGGSRELCSTNRYGLLNKLSVVRYLRLDITATASYTISALPLSSASGSGRPGLELFRRGELIGQAQSAAPGVQALLSLSLAPDSYVLAVYHWDNAVDDGDEGGRFCFQIGLQ